MKDNATVQAIIEELKALYPDAICSLDYDPDVSFANLENRLQMLVMNARDRAQRPDPARQTHPYAACL